MCNVGRYTSDEKGPEGAFRGLAGRVLRPPAPRPLRVPGAVPQPRGQAIQGRERGGSACARGRGAATPAFADLNGDGWPDLYLLNMQGARLLLRERRGNALRGPDGGLLSEDAVGQHGHQVLRLRQRRPPGPLRHRHALGHERGDRPRAGEAEVAHAMAAGVPGRRRLRLRQRVLPEPGRRPLRGGLGPARGRELLAVGDERRRRQRRRLGRRLHHLGDGLPLPLRHQHDAAERSRRPVRGLRVPAGNRAAEGRPHAHRVVRPGLRRARRRRAPSAAGGRDRSA